MNNETLRCLNCNHEFPPADGQPRPEGTFVTFTPWDGSDLSEGSVGPLKVACPRCDCPHLTEVT